MFLNYMSGLSKASLDCFSIWKIGVVGPPWVCGEDSMCYYLWLLLVMSALLQWLHYFTHVQSVPCLNGTSPCPRWAEVMVQTSLRLWVQNFLSLTPKIDLISSRSHLFGTFLGP